MRAFCFSPSFVITCGLVMFSTMCSVSSVVAWVVLRARALRVSRARAQQARSPAPPGPGPRPRPASETIQALRLLLSLSLLSPQVSRAPHLVAHLALAFFRVRRRIELLPCARALRPGRARPGRARARACDWEPQLPWARPYNTFVQYQKFWCESRIRQEAEGRHSHTVTGARQLHGGGQMLALTVSGSVTCESEPQKQLWVEGKI